MKRRSLSKKLTNTKRKNEIKERFGNMGCVVKTPRDTRYFALLLPKPGPLPGQVSEADFRVVDVRTLRIPMLRDAITRATEEAEKGALSPGDLEIVLDYLFAELNTRLQRNLKGKS